MIGSAAILAVAGSDPAAAALVFKAALAEDAAAGETGRSPSPRGASPYGGEPSPLATVARVANEAAAIATLDADLNSGNPATVAPDVARGTAAPVQVSAEAQAALFAAELPGCTPNDADGQL